MHHLRNDLLTLLRKEDHFITFFQDSGIWILDIANVKNHWISNEFWTRMGYQSQALPEFFQSWQQLIHPDDLSVFTTWLQACLSHPDQSFEPIIRYLHQNGSIRWFRCRGMAVRDESGQAQLLVISHQDITQEKEAEERYWRQSRLYEAMLDSEVVYLVSTDLNGCYTFVSENYAQFLGLKPSALIGQPATRWIGKNDWALYQKTIRSCLARPRVPHTVSFHTCSGQGEVTEWTLTALENEQGQVTEIFSLGRRITESLTLKRNLSILLEHTRDLVWVTSLQGNLSYVSPSWQRYGEEQPMVGEPIQSYLHPADERATLDLLACVPGSGGGRIRHRLRHPEGHYQWLETQVSFNAFTQEVVWISHDMTELKPVERELEKSKELLEETSRMVKVGVWEVMLETGITYWSDVSKEIHEVPLDYQPEMSRSMDFFVDEKAKERLNQALSQAIGQGTPWDLEVQIQTAQRQLRWVNMKGQVEWSQGKAIRLLGTYQDIEDQKRAQSQAEQAQQIAEQASRAKSEFLASMSHEIRTPLNGVIGLTELLLQTSLDENQQLYQKTVYESAQTLLALTNDILELSKIEAGKLSLAPEPASLEDLCEQSLAVITPLAQDKGLEVLLDLDHRIPSLVYFDALRLRQILINLLGNAAKFTQEGEIELKVTVLRQTASEISLQFSVRDSGIGIEMENQRKIFEAFMQEDLSTTKKFGGTGLGLTISSRLLSLMNSQFSLKSEAGKGSCFAFDLSLPLLTQPSQPEPDYPYLEAIQSVLIVSANEGNERILARTLAGRGINSSKAGNGLEALTFLQKQRFDVILMDYDMPYLNGTETLAKMKNYHSESLPAVVFMGTSVQALTLEQGPPLLIKPIKRATLLTTLSNLFKPVAEVAAIEPVRVEVAEQVSIIEGTGSVLIAEDNAVNRLLARKLIGSLRPDLIIYEAHNGKECVEAFERLQPDLILMDIQMPEMDGCEATQRIRSVEERHTPILALTASVLPEERDKCLETGMDDYLTKPIDRTLLKEALEMWIPAKTT